MQNKEGIIELIRKCLALSESPNEHEAAAAMSKAQELLLKHNLDMASIVTPKAEDIEESGLINEIVDFSESEIWEKNLLNSISKRNFCHVISTPEGIHILGQRANVRSIVAMYNWLEPQIMRLTKASGYTRGHKKSYALGIVSTISHKLDESKESYQANNPMSRALIVNIQSKIDSYFKQEYPRTRSSRSSVYTGAYNHGKTDGSKVSIYNASSQVSGRFLLA